MVQLFQVRQVFLCWNVPSSIFLFLFSSLQKHGCAVAACCRFFARSLWLPGSTYDSVFDNFCYSSGHAAIPVVLTQFPARPFAQKQRVYIISRIALMSRLIIGLVKSSIVHALAQRKLRRSIWRRTLCQTVSKHFDFYGRVAINFGLALPTRAAEFTVRESMASRRDTNDGRRTRQRA